MGGITAQTDPALMAVLANRLESIARQMAHTLHRTARSGLINTARDLSCCIPTADHELVSEAESLPSHVLMGPDIMSRWPKQWHPDVKRGEAFLHNSPYHGNSHAADHTLMIPVVDDEGRRRFTVFANASAHAQPAKLPRLFRRAPQRGGHVDQLLDRNVRAPAATDPRAPA